MAKQSPLQQFIRIIDRKGRVHVVPDNRSNRKFHVEHATKAQPGDKPKGIFLVTGKYVKGEVRGAQEFEEAEVLETLFENLTAEDSKLNAANSENEALKAQIEALQKQLSKKSKADGAGDED